MSSNARYLTVETPHMHRSMPNLNSPDAGRAEYTCKSCRACIATKDAILSWDYRGSKGKAALFTQATNVSLEQPSMLLMDSGAYRVQHSHCASCSTTVGWKFVRASEKTEKWKEGYFLLELALLQEETVPPSPLEEMQKAYVFQVHRLSHLGTGHRRVASDTSSRQRPLGPRQRSPTSMYIE